MHVYVSMHGHARVGTWGCLCKSCGFSSMCNKEDYTGFILDCSCINFTKLFSTKPRPAWGGCTKLVTCSLWPSYEAWLLQPTRSRVCRGRVDQSQWQSNYTILRWNDLTPSILESPLFLGGRICQFLADNLLSVSHLIPWIRNPGHQHHYAFNKKPFILRCAPSCAAALQAVPGPQVARSGGLRDQAVGLRISGVSKLKLLAGRRLIGSCLHKTLGELAEESCNTIAAMATSQN